MRSTSCSRCFSAPEPLFSKRAKRCSTSRWSSMSRSRAWGSPRRRGDAARLLVVDRLVPEPAFLALDAAPVGLAAFFAPAAAFFGLAAFVAREAVCLALAAAFFVPEAAFLAARGAAFFAGDAVLFAAPAVFFAGREAR